METDMKPSLRKKLVVHRMAQAQDYRGLKFITALCSVAGQHFDMDAKWANVTCRRCLRMKPCRSFKEK
jgi:hypothetical protein